MIRACLAAMVLASPALAQSQPCGPRDQVVAHLGTKYAESRRAMGLTGNSMVMELWASEGGSWTITLTRPDGVMCLVGSGQGFEAVAPGEAM